MPALDNLQLIINQIAPNNEFQDWVLGTTYEKRTSPWNTLLDRLRRQSQSGQRLDIDALNEGFYKDVRTQVQRYAGPNERNANDTQRAAIRAYLEQLRHPVTVEDVYGTQR